ncbi:MAG: phytoene desaturase family protein [Hyphomicrobiales bacterium]
MSQQKEKVVIIGAGPGGLAISMLLANAGLDVTVLEKRDRVGGRTGQIKQDGYTFDIGPTFFLYPPVLERIFSQCGFSLWDEVPMKQLDPLYRIEFENRGHLDARSDVGVMSEEIARLSPNDALNLERYMAENRKKLEHFRPVLESPFEGIADYLRPDVLKSALMLRPQLSLDSDLERYFQDDRVRQAFSFQSKYLGMSPFNCPSLFTILAFLEYEYGVYHPIGGCGAVMQRMAELAESMGVEIKLSEGVDELEFEGKKASAAVTSKGRYPCSRLIINADFAETMKQLVPNKLRKRWTDKKLEKKKFSCSTYMLYLGLDGTYDDLPHHTIFLSEDLRKNVHEIQHLKTIPEHPSFYVQNACVNDPSLAPDGKSTLYVLMPVGNLDGPVDWHQEQVGLREFALDQLEKVGVANVRDRIELEHSLTPQDWSKDLSVFKGATFNLAHTLTQMLSFRPRNRFEDLQGVYLVGGGTHPGSGLPVIFESANISAKLIADDIGISLSPAPGSKDARFMSDLQMERAPT